MVMVRTIHSLAILILLVATPAIGIESAKSQSTNGIIVYQSDFGLRDGAVSAMKGVALTVDPTLRLEDLTHDIPPFNIWEGAWHLHTTLHYWPVGTVFVSVIDPGVGTQRRSVVLKTRSGHYVVTPDNGTLTLVARTGIASLREIDETRHRLPGSEHSHTFHGRDIYSFMAARLASGQTSFSDVGPELPAKVTMIPYPDPTFSDSLVVGTIPILDIAFGNVWTNIGRATFKHLGATLNDILTVRIYNDNELVYDQRIPWVSTFGDVAKGDPLIYFNSADNLSFALNYGDFAHTHGVISGPEWRVEVSK